LILAVDVGLVINPDGVIIDRGGAISRQLDAQEQVSLVNAASQPRLGGLPILKISEAPAVEVE